MLGDATDDMKNYEIALELTNNKSARAWRAMGVANFYKKNYELAVEQLKNSLERSPFQPGTQLQLGYAAMQIEAWDVAAQAYRDYCCSETDVSLAKG